MESPQSGGALGGCREGRWAPARDWRWAGTPWGGEGCGEEGLVQASKLVREWAEGWWGAEGSGQEWAVGKGLRNPAEPGSRLGRGEIASPQAAPGGQVRGGRAWTSAASRRPNPPSSRGPALPAPARRPPPGPAASHLPGGRSAAPLLLHLAARTPAPPAARDQAGLQASSPSPPPPPPRIPGAAEPGAREAQSRRRRGRRPLRRTLGQRRPPAPRALTASRAPSCPGAAPPSAPHAAPLPA